MEKEVLDFLEKLTKLTKETGIMIEEFGDPFYRPELQKDFGCHVFFFWDSEKEKYVARKDCPYDGDIIE